MGSLNITSRIYNEADNPRALEIWNKTEMHEVIHCVI